MRQRFEEELDRVEQASHRAREMIQAGIVDEARIVLADVRLALANLHLSITTDEHRRQLRKLKRKHVRFLRVVARTEKFFSKDSVH